MTEIFDDIKKLYAFKNPCLELAKYIEFFSESCPNESGELIGEDELTVKLFPSFTPTIWLNLGTPYKLKNGHKTTLVSEKSDVLVLRNAIVERTILPTDNIFTIKFYPTAFQAIFGISQTKIGDSIVDVHALIPSVILKKMKGLASFEERIILLENFFLGKLAENRQKNHQFGIIQAATNSFIKSGMEMKNTELANQLAVTEKSFYRYFKQTIGTHPKNYFAIVRARTALMAYKNSKSSFSPYDFGYFDYGHFSKDVFRFTGSSLSFFNH